MSETAIIQPDTSLIRELMAAGAADLKKCHQCASCTAACDFSTAGLSFPRPQILAAQWGLRDRLLGDPAPWLCFYCGDCSEHCPRGANPGETMMALRRWLTAQYDWTGLSRLMCRSAAWELGVLGLLAAVVVLLFTLPRDFGFGLLAQSPAAFGTVMLDRFAPRLAVHRADTVLAACMALLVLSNGARMFRALTRHRGIPVSVWLKQFPELVSEALTQNRWRKCDNREAGRNWLRHLALVTGYVTIFILVVVFLPWFQVEDSGWHWTSLPGYYATAVLLGSTAWMLADRAGRRSEMHRFSRVSDWLLPTLLFLTAATGILLHLFRISNLPLPTYVTYVVHLAIAVPLLVVEVPFGKWAHRLYRPLAIYVAAAAEEVKMRAGEPTEGQAARRTKE